MVHTQQVLDTQSIGTVSMSIKYTYGVRAAADANQVHTDHAVLSHIEYTVLLPVDHRGQDTPQDCGNVRGVRYAVSTTRKVLRYPTDLSVTGREGQS